MKRIALLSTALACGALNSSAQSILPDPLPGPPTSAGYYYENYGQIIDDNGAACPSIRFYNDRGNARLFFADNVVHHVVRVPGDTTGSGGNPVPGTTARLDVRFDCVQWKESDMPCGSLEHEGLSPDFINYYLPHCGPSGITGVKGYKTVRYVNAFPNVDVHYTADARGPVMYFVLHPGANPSDVRLAMDGHTQLIELAGGDLKVVLGQQDILFPRGSVYQIDGSGNTYAIPTWFAQWDALNPSTVGLTTGAYNTNDALVIKIAVPPTPLSPTANQNLEWLTYYGGGADDQKGRMKADATGDLYHAMEVFGFDFPATAGLQTGWAGGKDLFITRFNPNASQKWMTYYGGSGDEFLAGVDISAGANGDAFIVGSTTSTNFPTQSLTGAYNQSANSSTISGSTSTRDGVIIALGKGDGMKTWATYFGSTGREAINGIDVNDAEGKFFITGSTSLTSASATQSCNAAPAAAGEFPLCSGPSSATRYYDGTPNGNTDCFVAEFDIAAKSIEWSTFFGGDGPDFPNDITTSGSGTSLSIAIVGESNSTISSNDQSPDRSSTPQGAFPVTSNGSGSYSQTYNNNGYDGFLVQFNASRRLQVGTYFGGNGDDVPTAVRMAAAGDVYISGYTSSVPTYSNDDDVAGYFPTYSGVANGTSPGSRFYQRDPAFPNANNNNYVGRNNGGYDAFLLRFSNNGFLKWGSLLGGAADEGDIGTAGSPVSLVSLAIDNSNNVYVTGPTRSINSAGASTNFPVVSLAGVYQQNNNASAGTTHPQKVDGWLMLFNGVDELRWATFFGETGTATTNFIDANAFDAPTGLTIGGTAPSEKLFISGTTLDVNLKNLCQCPIPGTSYCDNNFSNASYSNPDVSVGRFDIAAIIAAGVRNAASSDASLFDVHPNPSTGIFVLDFTVETPNPNAQLTVTNAAGQVLLSQPLSIHSGANRVGVDLTPFSTGVYLVQLETGKAVSTIKVVKQ